MTDGFATGDGMADGALAIGDDGSLIVGAPAKAVRKPKMRRLKACMAKGSELGKYSGMNEKLIQK